MAADHNRFSSWAMTKRLISFVLECQDERICSEDEGDQIRPSYWGIINSQPSQPTSSNSSRAINLTYSDPPLVSSIILLSY